LSEVLKNLGLTVEEVREAFGTPEPDTSKNRDGSSKRYLNANDQLRMKRRLQLYEGFILARFSEGYHPGTIGRILACSEESVRVRLRRAGFFRD